MEEKTSIWNTKAEDLTVGQQIQASVVTTVVMTGLVVAPLWIWGTIAERRQLKKLQKQDKLAIVDNTTDEE